MISELIKELQELEQFKQKCAYAEIDKARMSEELLVLMTEKYNQTSYMQRVNYYKLNACKDCRFSGDCAITLPDDIGKPIASDKAWIPGTKSCGKFEWD